MAETKTADRLLATLERYNALAIAVSGGVDSMTLATFAHRNAATDIVVMHAVSPAVPAEATNRVRGHAEAEGWNLIVTGTGEFDDSRYRDNPTDRCYFCKVNLYDRIRDLTPHAIASGANVDDLGDYRPGLLAAGERNVVHPMVEAGMTKRDVRALARSLELADIAEMPAQPCLASRIETGIAIDAADLAFVEATERRLAALAGRNATLRCRITGNGVVLEIGDELDALTDRLAQLAGMLSVAEGRVFAGVRSYTRGSMFVGDR